MINISTKTGDSGQTGLANGQRLAKSAPIFEVIGNIDELNSWLGLVVAKLGPTFRKEKTFLLMIQQELFVLGGELAKAKNCLMDKELLLKIEKRTDQLQQKMAEGWHKQFLLPGGTEMAAEIDVARTVCRRAERSLVDLSEVEEVRPLLLKTLNRLSDYLYVFRCFVNWTSQVEEKKFERNKVS
ncbi:MAG: cob(I)yrinic acid a,c-diamide adenosyltransferase [Patescibacteria group bacterium]